MASDSVKSIMSSRVISVLPETPVIVAIDIILSNNFNGIPVVDKVGIIVGILTKYDLIVNKNNLRDDSKVKDIMNRDPLVLNENMTVDDAIQAFAEHHKVDPIPVVDMDRKVIGMITRFDMVKLFKEYGLSSNSKTSPPSRASSILPWIVISAFVLLGVLYYLGYLDSLGLAS